MLVSLSSYFMGAKVYNDFTGAKVYNDFMGAKWFAFGGEKDSEL